MNAVYSLCFPLGSRIKCYNFGKKDLIFFVVNFFLITRLTKQSFVLSAYFISISSSWFQFSLFSVKVAFFLRR